MASNTSLKRAHHPEQKELRRGHILEAARRLILQSSYENVSMAQIALAAGVAKGTVYIYFPTKEALFLALISEEYEQIFGQMNTDLAALSAPADVDAVAAAISDSTISRPLFMQLIGVLHNVLEGNITVPAARNFKSFLRDHALVTGKRLEQLLPSFSEGDGARLLLTSHSLTVGWQHLSNPAPVVAEVIKSPDLQMFQVDFNTAFKSSLAAIIRGWRAM